MSNFQCSMKTELYADGEYNFREKGQQRPNGQ